MCRPSCPPRSLYRFRRDRSQSRPSRTAPYWSSGPAKYSDNPRAPAPREPPRDAANVRTPYKTPRPSSEGRRLYQKPRRFRGYTPRTPQVTETTPSKYEPDGSKPRDSLGSIRSPGCNWKATGPAGAPPPKHPRRPPLPWPHRCHKPRPNTSSPWRQYWPQPAESTHLARTLRRT